MDRGICFNGYFLLGFLFKLILIGVVLPAPIQSWYLPFIEFSLAANGFMDPWATWLEQGGDSEAFPYGYAMWLYFLPLSWISINLGIPLSIGYGVSVLIADVLVLVVLSRLLKKENINLLLLAYWCSPVILAATYVLGHNDIVPVLFLMASLMLIKENNFLYSGVLFTISVSAKLSMVLAFPFILIYFIHNNSIRHFLPSFIAGVLISLVVLMCPYMFSEAALTMLLENPEMDKVYSLMITLGEESKLYIVPIVYGFMLYAVWQIRRPNFELFQSTLGLAFMLVILFTDASPGWFVWIVPLLVMYQCSSDSYAVVLTLFFSIAFLFKNFLDLSEVFNFIIPLVTKLLQGDRLTYLAQTLITALGLLLALRIWRESIVNNDYFRLSRKPFVILVAGDSGAGKDTFSDSIEGLFGSHSVSKISGDDYHLWDRQKPMWQVMTHLNPMANDLQSFAKDIIDLNDGKSIKSRHYDHETGRFSKPLEKKSRDLIIASGLHALYTPIVRDCGDLKIFLDIDEELRQFLKIQRDVNERGHTYERVQNSIERRKPDSIKFIKPQLEFADLIFSVKPVNPILSVGNDASVFKLKLSAISKYGLNERLLIRVLVGVQGLRVDMTNNLDKQSIELLIEGDCSSDDIEFAAKKIFPSLFDFLDLAPKWEGGVIGIMQLITLSHIEQLLTKRFFR